MSSWMVFAQSIRRFPISLGRAHALALAVSFFAGCGGGAEQVVPPGDPVPRQGSMRFVNAIADAPRISALLSGGSVADIDYGQASPLAKYLVGIYNLALVYADPDGNVVTIETVNRIELTQEDEVNFLLLGTWATPELVRIDNIEIDFGVTAGNIGDHLNKADVQVVHAATASGAVDVYLTTVGADLATATPLARVSFGDVDALETVTPGTNFQVRVTPVGAIAPVLFDSGQFEIAGFTRQIFLVGDYQGPGAQTLRVSRVAAAGVFSFPNEALESQIQFVNYVADAPSVDLYFVDTMNPPVFADVTYTERTPRTVVAPGLRNVKVTPTGVTTPFVLESSANVGSGVFQTLFISGRDQGDTAVIVSALDDIRTIATEARVRFDNAAPAAGAIDVYILPAGQPIADAAPTFSAFGVSGRRVASLLAGSYDVTVVRSGTRVSLVGPERISVDLGGLYTLALVDSVGGGAPVALLPLDDLAP